MVKMLILSTAFFLIGFVALSYGNSTDVDGRIYGGSTARLGQFPFQAHLQITSRSGSFMCGGCLISDQWVLTAAHCTEGARSIRVRLGTIDFTSNGGQTRTSKQHIEHPKYDSAKILNDIALIKVPTKFNLNGNVNVIKLPKRAQAPVGTFAGKTAIISGWGRTSNWNARSVRNLQFATARVMNHANCQRYYSRFNVGTGEICTNNAVTRSGTCQGDSGGPLSITQNGETYLIGLTSWGVSMCRSSAPSVYTNVAAYLGFINQKTGIPVN